MSLHTILPETLPRLYYWVADGDCPNCYNDGRDPTKRFHHDCARRFFGGKTYEVYYCECYSCRHQPYTHYFESSLSEDTICKECIEDNHPIRRN